MNTHICLYIHIYVGRETETDRPTEKRDFVVYAYILCFYLVFVLILFIVNIRKYSQEYSPNGSEFIQINCCFNLHKFTKIFYPREARD